MIQRSDGPKTYWGYYQQYLVEISGKKIRKKIPSIFSKNHKGIQYGRKKWPKRKWRPIFKFGPKIEWTCPVEYVDENIASSYGLTRL